MNGYHGGLQNPRVAGSIPTGGKHATQQLPYIRFTFSFCCHIRYTISSCICPTEILLFTTKQHENVNTANLV